MFYNFSVYPSLVKLQERNFIAPKIHFIDGKERARGSKKKGLEGVRLELIAAHFLAAASAFRVPRSFVFAAVERNSRLIVNS